MFIRFWLLVAAFCFAMHFNNARAASNEHFRDGIDKLRDMDISNYCMNVAEYWDDGIWARSMGIADAIFGRSAEEPAQYTVEALPREGIHHHAWDGLNAREQQWYAAHFHQGWKDGATFIAENPTLLVADPRDMSGVIPFPIRMAMKEARFNLCLHEGRPRES
jgi:hypothetical protein